MNHWSETVKVILQSRSANLRELAGLANADPRKFYAYQSLAGCDLRGQDLAGMDLTDCEIEKALIDKQTIIDPKFEFRGEIGPLYSTFYIPYKLNEAVARFSAFYRYVYRAWAYKNLFGRFARALGTDRMIKVMSIIQDRKGLFDLVLRGSAGPFDEVTVLLMPKQLEALNKFRRSYHEFDAESFALLAGLLLSRLPYTRIDPHFQLPMDAYWGLELELR